MKKLFLLAATALICSTADAQLAAPVSVAGGANDPIETVKVRNTDFRPHAKSSIAGGRWYNHSSVVDFLTGGALMNFSLWPIWFDSSASQLFIDGLHPVNYISAAQVIDPIHFTLWNDPNVFDPNIIAIEPESSYSIDSIAFAGAYVKNVNRPWQVVDTLIFSVSVTSPTSGSSMYSTSPGVSAWSSAYVCTACPDSVLKGFTVFSVDSIKRASAVTGVVSWKVPLDSGMRQTDSAGFVSILNYTFPTMVMGVPAPIAITAGKSAVVTVTFKSGDVIIPNDTFTQYHRLFLYSGEALGAGATMPYYHYQYRDRNSSNLMFYFDSASYYPSIFIEGWNQPSFRQEFHDIQAHIVCNDCPTVAEYASVKTVNSVVTADINAYPNPANTDVTVTFLLDQNASANVFITNSVGQVVATQQVNNAIANQESKVTFSTANLAAGVYFYTVEANGQRTTSRFAVSH